MARTETPIVCLGPMKDGVISKGIGDGYNMGMVLLVIGSGGSRAFSRYQVKYNTFITHWTSSENGRTC